MAVFRGVDYMLIDSEFSDDELLALVNDTLEINTFSFDAMAGTIACHPRTRRLSRT